jgi:hypothetical protein
MYYISITVVLLYYMYYISITVVLLYYMYYISITVVFKKFGVIIGDWVAQLRETQV